MALYNGLDKKLGLRDLDFTGGTNYSGLPDPSAAGPYTRQNVRQALGQDNGSRVVTAGEVTANVITIQTAFTTSTVIQASFYVLRSGAVVTTATVVPTFGAGTGTVVLTGGASYTVTTGDIIVWEAMVNA